MTASLSTRRCRGGWRTGSGNGSVTSWRTTSIRRITSSWSTAGTWLWVSPPSSRRPQRTRVSAGIGRRTGGNRSLHSRSRRKRTGAPEQTQQHCALPGFGKVSRWPNPSGLGAARNWCLLHRTCWSRNSTRSGVLPSSHCRCGRPFAFQFRHSVGACRRDCAQLNWCWTAPIAADATADVSFVGHARRRSLHRTNDTGHAILDRKPSGSRISWRMASSSGSTAGSRRRHRRVPPFRSTRQAVHGRTDGRALGRGVADRYDEAE